MIWRPRSGGSGAPQAAFLTLCALLLGVGSFLWAKRYPEYPWDGPLILLAATGFLLVAQRRLEGRRSLAGSRNWPSLTDVPRWRLFTFASSIVLAILLLGRLLVPERPSYRPDLLLWFASIVTFTLSVAPPVRRPREVWSLWWEVNRGTVMLLAGIVLIGFALRVWNLGAVPARLDIVEGAQEIETLHVLSGAVRNPFSTDSQGTPAMAFYLSAFFHEYLGSTLAVLRLPWALVGTATILTTFWLVTRLSGLPLGLITAALLATYHFHIHFSRLGSSRIAATFFLSLALLFLYRARDRGSPLDWTLAGVVVGAAQYFCDDAYLLLVVVIECLLYFLWQNRNRSDTLRDLLGGMFTVVGAFLVTAAPMIQYEIRFPGDSPLGLVGRMVLRGDELAREAMLRGTSTVAVLGEEFLRTVLAFNLYPDRSLWYDSRAPLMDGLWSMLFMIGLLYCTLRLFSPGADRGLFPLVAWWWSGVLLAGLLSTSTPSSYHLIVLVPPAIFFVAVTLLRATQFVWEAWGTRDLRSIAPLLVVVVVFLGGLSVHRYFSAYASRYVYNSELLQEQVAQRGGEVAHGGLVLDKLIFQAYER